MSGSPLRAQYVIVGDTLTCAGEVNRRIIAEGSGVPLLIDPADAKWVTGDRLRNALLDLNYQGPQRAIPFVLMELTDPTKWSAQLLRQLRSDPKFPGFRSTRDHIAHLRKKSPTPTQQDFDYADRVVAEMSAVFAGYAINKPRRKKVA